MRFSVDTVARYLKYVIGLAEILLALRVLLMFLEANPLTPIVEFLYRATDGIMAPFSGIFNDIVLRNGSVIDLSALSTMVGYPIILYIFIELLHLVLKSEEKEKGVR